MDFIQTPPPSFRPTPSQGQPPPYAETVHKSSPDENSLDGGAVINTVVVNGRMVQTENVAYTENSGRLSIVSRTSITGFPIHRLQQISVQTKRARKRRIRHFSCVVFGIIMALGIPALTVLMTSGVMRGRASEKTQETQNGTDKPTETMQELPGEDKAQIRKRSIKSSADQSVERGDRVKRYQDLLYRLNNARMHSGLHNHKKFVSKFLEVLMAYYRQHTKVPTNITAK